MLNAAGRSGKYEGLARSLLAPPSLSRPAGVCVGLRGNRGGGKHPIHSLLQRVVARESLTSSTSVIVWTGMKADEK